MTKKINFKDLRPQTGCVNQIPELGLETRKTTVYNEAVVMKSTIKEVLSGNLDVSNIGPYVEQEYKKIEHMQKAQREDKAEEMIALLKRFLEQEVPKRKNQKKMMVEKGYVETGEWKIEVNPDNIYSYRRKYVCKEKTYDNIPVYEAVVYKRGRKEITSRGKTIFTSEKDSVVLGAVIEYLRNKYGSKECLLKATICFMKQKNEKEELNEYSEEGNEASVECLSDNLEPKVRFEKNMREFGLKACSKSNCDKCSMKSICTFKFPPVRKPDENKAEFKIENVQLTKPQQEAINAREGIYRINAGAGVGKTLVLSIRIVELLVSGVKPEEIMVTTFTNAGADELHKRVNAIGREYGLREKDVKKVNIMTLNSIGSMIINDFYEELGYTEKPRLLDKVKSIDILLELLDREGKIEGLDYKNLFMNQPKYKGAVHTLLCIFEEIQAERMSESEYIRKAAELADEDEYSNIKERAAQIYQFYEKYAEELVRKNYISYADQEDAAFKVLVNHPVLFCEKYRYSHILIDEFQDCSERQIELATEMMSNPDFKSLMVVGDDSQAIYGFRHTSPKYIIDFPKYIGSDDVNDIFIVENRRSSPEIINLANHVNELNENRIKKDLIPVKEPNGKIPLLYGEEFEENLIEDLAENVKKQIDDGCSLEDICIIAMKKTELLKIQSELSKLSVPSMLKVNENIFDNSRVQALISLAKFFEQPEDSTSLLTYLNALSENKIIGMKNTEIKALIDINQSEYNRLIKNMTEEECMEYFLRCAEALDDDRDTIYKGFLQEVKDYEPSGFMDLVYYIIKNETYNIKKEALQEGEYNAVTLTTAHSSKGKEWPVVYADISNFDQTDLNNSEEIEERRRLLFVAITRAKDELYIYSTMKKGSERSVVYRDNRFYSELEKMADENIIKKHVLLPFR